MHWSQLRHSDLENKSPSWISLHPDQPPYEGFSKSTDGSSELGKLM